MQALRAKMVRDSRIYSQQQSQLQSQHPSIIPYYPLPNIGNTNNFTTVPINRQEQRDQAAYKQGYVLQHSILPAQQNLTYVSNGSNINPVPIAQTFMNEYNPHSYSQTPGNNYPSSLITFQK